MESNYGASMSYSDAEEQIISLVQDSDPDVCRNYFSAFSALEGKHDETRKVLDFFVELSTPGPLRDNLHLAFENNNSQSDLDSSQAVTSVLNRFVEREQKLALAVEQYRESFPMQVWHCCKRRCFASLAVDSKKYNEMRDLLLIHDHAERCHADREGVSYIIEKRRKGVGRSGLVFVSKSRKEREAASDEFHGTAREEKLRKLAGFVKQVLPFLYAEVESPLGRSKLPTKLCTEAICSILGISRNFLYHRKAGGVDGELSSLLDDCGHRSREHRRNGLRVSCPELENLPEYDCGCEIPCFANAETWALVIEYEEFAQLSREFRPRRKENCFLLNRLYDPYSNSSHSICNKAFAALYNVSGSYIADIRRTLHTMCQDESTFDKELLKHGAKRSNYENSHPMNRYDDSVRERIENHLDIVLRADPAGSDGSSVCRVYSPEINTYEKLRETLRKALATDEEVDEDLSASTIQRMVNTYLKQRNYKAISFTQSDHNACPQCKTLQYSILLYTNEALLIQRDIDFLRKNASNDGLTVQEKQTRLHELEIALSNKRCQETDCVKEMQSHNDRDMRIREKLKEISDHFRDSERYFRSLPESSADFKGWGWRSYSNRASVTHQDDMTKVDLPHFIVTASADITRWRFDVNAHVNAVTNDAIVFSHEQGMGAKNGGLIVEEVLLEHILRCKGESIKFVVSDNASVGKNWITTIALPQYMVDQGLAEVVVIVYLENNHGKWLADMMFGQFQTRRRRQTLFSIDDMLSGFEAIKKKYGKVEGFALNPLGSVDFEGVFRSLGYEVTPPKDFAFIKRNIHFAAACAQGARGHLSPELTTLFGDMLPNEPGMVRISTEPPGDRKQCELRYEDRYFDVPAVRHSLLAKSELHSAKPSAVEPSELVSLREETVPLVVSLQKGFMESGHGVVSARTADKVGYNGLRFRKHVKACPELNQLSSKLVRRAWPKDLLDSDDEDESVSQSKAVKCAPVNWLVRKPVGHFCEHELDWKARYPPRNLLNADIGQGPREESPWVPTATYVEPPVPIFEKTSAYNAMKRLATQHSEWGKPLHTLHMLREVFRCMGDRDGAADIWLQRSATIPSRTAIHRYKSELALYNERERGHPKAVKTLKKVFKEDMKVLEVVETEISEKGLRGSQAKKVRDAAFARLYRNAEKRPGGLARFKNLVAKDHERYAAELEQFKEKQQQFDVEHSLQAVAACTNAS